MARPRQFDEADVKAALRDVFWKHGYEGASYADIVAATGLQKGSLYASFGNKEQLYLHALSDYDENVVAPGIDMLEDNNLSAHDRLAALFNGLIEAAETMQGRWGCLICNAAIDRAPFDKNAEDTVQSVTRRLRDAIAVAVSGTAAKDKAALILSIYFGGRVKVKAGYTKSEMKDLKAQTLSLLN